MESGKLVGLQHGYGDGDGLVFVNHKTPINGFWRMGSRLHFGKDIDTQTGAVHKWPYIPKLCEHGLHACLDLGDTSKWNKGRLFRVACSGWVKFQNDKFACTRRVILEAVA